MEIPTEYTREEQLSHLMTTYIMSYVYLQDAHLTEDAVQDTFVKGTAHSIPFAAMPLKKHG